MVVMRRVGVIVTLGALLGMFGGLVTASPALAAGRGDGWQFVPIPRHFTESACGTEIQGTQLVDRVFVKALKTANGSMIFLFTGAAKIAFTNPGNGKSITVNTSGPLKEIAFPDGSATFLGKGHQPVNLGPADAARFGLPAFFVSAGALTGTVDANGNLTSLSLQGHVLVDLCAALS
jgi:hypothetical protein